MAYPAAITNLPQTDPALAFVCTTEPLRNWSPPAPPTTAQSAPHRTRTPFSHPPPASPPLTMPIDAEVRCATQGFRSRKPIRARMDLPPTNSKPPMASPPNLFRHRIIDPENKAPAPLTTVLRHRGPCRHRCQQNHPRARQRRPTKQFGSHLEKWDMRKTVLV